MKKRILAIALCLIMVSAFVVTSAVSAKSDNSAIRQFDFKGKSSITSGIATIGKLTIDTNSGHYTINFNWARIDTQTKKLAKDFYRQKGQYQWHLFLLNTKTNEIVDLGFIAFTNNGGNAHGEGTLSVSQADLAKIAGWNPADVDVGGYQQPVPTT